MTLARRVDRERARLRVLEKVRGVSQAAAGVAVVIAVAILALAHARWLALPAALPVIAWIVAAGAGGLLLLVGRTQGLNATSRPAVSAAVERERGLRTGSLGGALEVIESGTLGAHAVAQITERVGAAPVLAPRLHATVRARATIAAGGALAALMLVTATAISASDGWLPLAHPLRAWTGALLPPLRVDAPRALVRGERARVEIVAPGRRTVVVHERRTGDAWDTTRVDVTNGHAGAVLAPLDADARVYVTDGRVASDTLAIQLAERPFVGDVAVSAIFPAYLARGTEPLVLGEITRVPRGTTISVTGRASVSLSDVVLDGGHGVIALTPNGQRFSGRFEAQAGTWKWGARAHGGNISDVPAPLMLEITPDTAPRVQIVLPRTDTTISASDRLPVLVQAYDDHGVRRIALRSWRVPASGAAQPAVQEALPIRDAAPVTAQTVIDGAMRGLAPGDVLHIVAVATDDSPWAQNGTSAEVVIRVLDASEQRALARATADSAIAAANSAAAAARDLAQRTGEQAHERDRSSDTPRPANGSPPSATASTQTMSFDAAAKAKALAQDQAALAQRVQRVQQAAAAVEQQLRQAGALDSALAQQLREVQRLLQDAITPEMQEQMRQLQQSLQRLDGDAARQQMGDLAAAQQRLREQLEKSAQMLQRAALEGAMQTLRDEARDLAQGERALADSTRDPASAARAADLGRRSSALANATADLGRRLQQQKAELGAQRASAASQSAQQSADAMQRGQRDAANNASADATADMRAGADAMEDAARTLDEARSGQIAAWKQELTKELDAAIQEMLSMARDEGALGDRAQQGGDPGAMRGDQGALQQGVARTRERLDSAARKTALLTPGSQRAMGTASEEVKQATDALQRSRSGSEAVSQLRDAEAALNQAAAALVRDRDRANSAQSASGFAEMMQALQQLAKKQGQLSAQGSGLSLMPGGANAAAGLSAARALAQQQRALARALDSLGDFDGSGRTNALAKEARDVAQALDRTGPTAATLARQQQLYHRLLDAGRSMEQEQHDDKAPRQAVAAADTTHLFTPDSTSVHGRAGVKFRAPTWDELRGLTPDERRVVLEYFRRINEQPANP